MSTSTMKSKPVVHTNLLKVPVTVHTRAGDMRLTEVNRLSRVRTYGGRRLAIDRTDKVPVHGWREACAKSRLYVHLQGEGVLANFANRTSRPYTAYRELLPSVYAALGLDPTKVSAKWSQHAGCSMCPCSPGFILTIEGQSEYERFDAWVTVKAAPQEMTEKGANRLLQVIADPTMPFGTADEKRAAREVLS